MALPENSRPVAIVPACGSVWALVMHMTVGPLSLQLSMACPVSVWVSPCQIFGIRYFCACCGLGRCLLTMFSMAWCSGMVVCSCW